MRALDGCQNLLERCEVFDTVERCPTKEDCDAHGCEGSLPPETVGYKSWLASRSLVMHPERK
jgi:hypothetical protein